MDLSRESSIDLIRVDSSDMSTTGPIRIQKLFPKRKKEKKPKSKFSKEVKKKLRKKRKNDVVEILGPREFPKYGSSEQLFDLMDDLSLSAKKGDSEVFLPTRLTTFHSNVKAVGPEMSDNDELRLFELLCEIKKEAELRASDKLPKPIPVRREEMKLFFRRGYRADGLRMDTKVCFVPSITTAVTLRETSEEAVIYFSEYEEPVDFLVGLGFNVEEASLALFQEEVKKRIKLSLIEARVWVNYLTVNQGTLLFLLAHIMKPFVMRYFQQMVEAIVNNRITNATQLDTFRVVLEKTEEGIMHITPELGTLQTLQTIRELCGHTLFVRRFMSAYTIANEEAKAVHGGCIGPQEAALLEHVCINYRPGLKTHMKLLSRYIGHGLLRTALQLDAAMVYLMRFESDEVDVADFEDFCGVTNI